MDKERGIIIAGPDAKTKDGKLIDIKTINKSLKLDYKKFKKTALEHLEPEEILIEKPITNPFNRQGNKVFIKKR